MLEYLKHLVAPCIAVIKYKDSIFIAKLNFDYAAELAAEQVADGQEVTPPGKRNWGVRLPNCPLVEHKGNHYLSCWVTKTISGEPKSGVRDLKIENIQFLSIGGTLFFGES